MDASNPRSKSIYGNRLFKWIRRVYAGSPALRSKHGVALALDILAANGVGDISIPSSTGGRLYLSTKDKMISTVVINTGCFGRDEIAAFITQLANSGINTASILFVNVGANIGMTIRHAYDAGIRRFLALEPDPENYRLLRLNVEPLPGTSGRLLQIAAGERSGHAKLHLDPKNLGAHSLLSNAGSINETIDVSIEPLSDLIDPTDEFILFVDAEGFEPQIIRGAGDTLQRSCLAIVLEITPARYSDPDAADLIQRLKMFGSEIRLLATGEVLPWLEFQNKIKSREPGYFDISVLRTKR